MLDTTRSSSAKPSAATSVLTKSDYAALLRTLDFRPRLLPNLAIVALDALLLTAAVRLLRDGGPLQYALAQLLLPIVFFNAFSVLHECGHGSASSSRLLNTILGHVASGFCFIPFYSWKYIHQKHHTWTGNVERDPVLKSLRTWRRTGVPSIVRGSWRSWIPLGALLQHLVYWLYPLEMRRANELTFAKAWRCAVSSAWIPLSYAGLWALAPDVVRFGNILPAIFLFLIAEELVNIPHHVGAPTFSGKLPVWEQYQSTRSCYYPKGVSELLVLNFNFHIEHHLFPSLPWFRLRAVRDSLRALLAERYQEAIGIQWNLENRNRDLQTIVDSTPRIESTTSV